MIQKNEFKVKGRYKLQHFRAGKLINEFEYDNGVTDLGINTILDVNFRDAAAKLTLWAIGMISDPATLAAADTMASHAGWTEFVSYAEATRPLWAPATAAAKAISNSVARDFNINGSGVLHGTFCVNEDTKGGVTGTLWATAVFTAPITVNASDLIRVTYTVSGT